MRFHVGNLTLSKGAATVVEDDIGRVGGDTAGGSGGGIYLRCKNIAGAGALSATGGIAAASSSGFGGGGRVAVWVQNDLLGGAFTFDVAGGANSRRRRAAG